MNTLRILLVAGGALLLWACHKTPLPNPAVPPVTVRPTPDTRTFDYTQGGAPQERMLKKRLAVARFNDNIPVAESPFGQKQQVDVVGPGIHVHQEQIAPEDANVSLLFTEKMVDALSRTNRFVLIERKDINAILREISFGGTKGVDKEQSAKVGKVLGAQIILTGSYGRNENPETRSDPLALWLRMYDVETSRIVGTARATGKSEQEVIDRAVSEIVARMDKVPWVGKVASVVGDKFFLNAGSTDNVQIGDKFAIFSLGPEIRDPDSGERIGYQEEEAGRAEVVSVSERVAALKALDVKRDVKVGDKAQPSQ